MHKKTPSFSNPEFDCLLDKPVCCKPNEKCEDHYCVLYIVGLDGNEYAYVKSESILNQKFSNKSLTAYVKAMYSFFEEKPNYELFDKMSVKFKDLDGTPLMCFSFSTSKNNKTVPDQFEIRYGKT